MFLLEVRDAMHREGTISIPVEIVGFARNGRKAERDHLKDSPIPGVIPRIVAPL